MSFHWQYRVVKDDTGGHRIAEVYRRDSEGPSWTIDPVYPWGDTIEELRMDVRRMMSALEMPVLEEKDLFIAARKGVKDDE